jgi:hypothetical protein
MKHFQLSFDNSEDASCKVGEIMLLRRKFKAMHMDLGSKHGISAKALSIITSHHGKNIQLNWTFAHTTECHHLLR